MPSSTLLVIATTGGLANAMAGPVARSIIDLGPSAAATNLFGLGPATCLAAVISLHRLATGGTMPARLPGLSAAYLLAICCLAPSATLAWLALAAFALGILVAGQNDPSTRSGLVVLAALALREPLATLALHLLASPLIELDAAMVSALLRVGGDAVVRTGNIVGEAGDHQLIILTGCASFTNLSMALLAWFAVVRGQGAPLRRGHYAIGAMLGVAVVATNIVRLAGMGLGEAAYAWLHDGTGADLFNALLCLQVAVACALAVRHVR